MGWGGVCLSPNLKIQVTLKSMHQKELKTTSQNLIAQSFQENLFLSLSLTNPNILLCLLSVQSYPYTYTCQVGTCGGAEPWAARYRVFYDSKAKSQRAWRQQTVEGRGPACILDLTLVILSLGSSHKSKGFCNLASIIPMNRAITYSRARFVMKNL